MNTCDLRILIVFYIGNNLISVTLSPIYFLLDLGKIIGNIIENYVNNLTFLVFRLVAQRSCAVEINE